MVEEWRQVVGFPGYEVSSAGRVRSLKRDMILKQWPDKGYRCVYLRRDGRNWNLRVHLLVLEAFVGPSNGLEGNHENRLKDDNRRENLSWSTHKENMDHCVRTGGYDHRRKPVRSIDNKTGTIQNFRSINEAMRAGFRGDSITSCCDGYQESHKGRRWEYAV